MKRLLETFFAIGIGLGFIAIAIFGAFCIQPQYREYRLLDAQRRNLERTVDYKEGEIRNLRSKIQRFHTDPAFVEQIARKSKRIRPNEIVFESVDD